MTSMAANPQDGSTNSTRSGTRESWRLDVEAFNLFSGGKDGTSIHFESDPDLNIGVGRALGNPTDPAERQRRRLASQAGLVLVELGIDGDQQHRVRVQRTGNYPGPGEDRSLYEDAFNYPRENADAFILGDTIEALQAVLDQLLVMRTPQEARAAEHNAVTLGADAQRLGLTGTDGAAPQD